MESENRHIRECGGGHRRQSGNLMACQGGSASILCGGYGKTVPGFQLLLPAQTGWKTSGMTDKYQFEVSADGKTGRKWRKGNSPTCAPTPLSNPLISKHERTCALLPLHRYQFSGRQQRFRCGNKRFRHSRRQIKTSLTFLTRAFRFLRPECLFAARTHLQTGSGRQTGIKENGKGQARIPSNSPCSASIGWECPVYRRNGQKSKGTAPAWLPFQPPPVCGTY